eukprot:1495022-Amphidinium_carterae.1
MGHCWYLGMAPGEEVVAIVQHLLDEELVMCQAILLSLSLDVRALGTVSLVEEELMSHSRAFTTSMLGLGDNWYWQEVQSCKIAVTFPSLSHVQVLWLV